jgi:hypothetical protein
MKGRNHSEDLGEDVRIILKPIFERWSLRLWTGFIWLKMWSNGELL